MTVPTSYSEASFRTYLEEVLGAELVSILSIVSAAETEIIYDALLDYGVSDIANATDIKKLRLLGKVHLWKHVMGITAGRYNQTADGASLQRQQIHEMAKENYQMALNEALVYMPNYTMEIEEVEALQNPYKWYPAGDRYDMR